MFRDSNYELFPKVFQDNLCPLVTVGLLDAVLYVETFGLHQLYFV